MILPAQQIQEKCFEQNIPPLSGICRFDEIFQHCQPGCSLDSTQKGRMSTRVCGYGQAAAQEYERSGYFP